MVEEQREEFMAVWTHMVKTEQDKVLRETIEKRIPQTIAVRMTRNDIPQTWAITVFGIHNYC